MLGIPRLASHFSWNSANFDYTRDLEKDSFLCHSNRFDCHRIHPHTRQHHEWVDYTGARVSMRVPLWPANDVTIFGNSYSNRLNLFI